HGKIRGVSDLLRYQANAARAARRNRASLRRRAAHGRSHERVDPADLRDVRRDAAEPGWRARAHGDPVEVWIQEHQIDCEDPIRQRYATDHVEHRQRARIWLL